MMGGQALCFLRRRIVLLRVVLFSFLLLLVSPVAYAEKRVALVIGNSAYRPQGALTNPRNDATDVVAALRMHGFQVIEGFDLDKVALDRKLRDFAAALAGADVGLFFYAGHGLQVGGRNYIIPIDAQLRTLAQLEVETTRFDVVQRIMESEDRTNILFFDACRNNPFARNLAEAMGTRSTAIGRGLAPVQSGHGTLISFSTQPDNTAEDGIGRRNSPFTEALVRHLSSSNDEIMALLVDVRVDVMRVTNRKQIPWEHTALTGRFYFKSGANPAPPPSNPVLPAPVRPQANLPAPVRPLPNQAERAGALAAAKELVAAKGGNAVFGPLAPGIIEKVKSAFLQANPMLGKDLNEVAAKLRAEYAARTAEILDDVAELYTARFEERGDWDTLALFGCHPTRDQLNGAGLLWRISGGKISSMQTDWAAFDVNGDQHVFHRRPTPTTFVLPWRRPAP
jgi:hypothetical protein